MDKITVNEQITLVPLREEHFPYLIPWNQDAEILQWVEEDAKEFLSEDEITDIYRRALTHGKCFLIVADDIPIGECWLHEMDISEICQAYPDCLMYRMDYMIGEKSCHGRGIGTAIAQALLQYGFEKLHADILWGFTKENNIPSKRIFQRIGFSLDAIISVDIRGNIQKRYQYRMTREEYFGRTAEKT